MVLGDNSQLKRPLEPACQMKRFLANAVAVTSLACSSGGSGSGSAQDSGYLGCVARGARVRTPRGHRPIEDLAQGDEVLSLDSSTGTFHPARIAEIRRSRRECVRLIAGGRSLVLTSDHPIFDPVACAWAPAGDWVMRSRSHLLHVGDDHVRPAPVDDVTASAGLFDVFDLCVDHPLHNFIAEDVLVHNKPYAPKRCVLPDGGFVMEMERCACSGTGTGHIRCTAVDAAAICASCWDYVPADAGPAAVDAGEGEPDGGAG
jgi:hypothetical protein